MILKFDRNLTLRKSGFGPSLIYLLYHTIMILIDKILFYYTNVKIICQLFSLLLFILKISMNYTNILLIRQKINNLDFILIIICSGLHVFFFYFLCVYN